MTPQGYPKQGATRVARAGHGEPVLLLVNLLNGLTDPSKSVMHLIAERRELFLQPWFNLRYPRVSRLLEIVELIIVHC